MQLQNLSITKNRGAYNQSSASSSSTPSSSSFLISDTVEGQGIYDNWPEMWDAISATEGPQTITIYDHFQLNYPSIYNFDNRITLEGFSVTSPQATFISNGRTTFSGISSVRNLSVNVQNSTTPLLVIPNNGTLILDNVYLHRTQLISAVVYCQQGISSIKIVGRDSEFGQYAIANIADAFIANYGANTVFGNNWLVKYGESTPQTTINTYAAISTLSQVLPDYVNGITQFPTIISTVKYNINYGANIQSTGYPLVNGVASVNRVNASDVETQGVIPFTLGNVITIVYSNSSPDATTQMSIRINGTDITTFGLTQGNGEIVFEDQMNVVSGDYIEVYYSGSGTVPGKSIFTVVCDVMQW